MSEELKMHFLKIFNEGGRKKAYEDEKELKFIQEFIKSKLSLISLREQEILSLRFGLKNDIILSYEEIGKMFNFKRDRIWSIEARALRKLRDL